MIKKIIHLGCGKTKIPNSLGVDSIKIKGFVDVVHNLNTFPYPFQTNSIDEIHMYHVLEHLENPIKVLEEIHRILKLAGKLYFRVPHFSSMGAFTDITHKRPFGYSSFDVFEEKDSLSFYTKARFKIIKKEIKYLGHYPNEGIYEKYIHKNECPFILRPIVKLLNFLIRLSPFFFERVWCYLVGGALEINIEMEKDGKEIN